MSVHRIRKSISRVKFRLLDLFGAAERISYWERCDKDFFMLVGLRRTHRSRVEVADFIAHVMADRHFSILDCGVLSCVSIQELRMRNLKMHYTGIDISARAIAKGKDQFPDAQWHRMDVNALDFPDRSHDIVHIRAVLEHLPDYESAIREAHRCASEWVIIVLFLPLGKNDEPERIIKSRGVLYLNRYGRNRFMQLLNSLFDDVREVNVVDSGRPHQIFFCRVRGGATQVAEQHTHARPHKRLRALPE